MADPQIDWPDLSSPMVHFPAHLQAIGLISVEISSMEVMLGDLLGALLNLSPDESHLIYFTPRAAIARIDVLVNVAICNTFDAHPVIRAKAVSLAKRAKAVMGKRHDIIHAHWVPLADWTMVGRVKAPIDFSEMPAEVKLEDLTQLARDVQSLIREVRLFIDEAAEALRPETWPQTRARSARTAAGLTQDSHRLEALLQARKDQPGPSQA